MRTEAKVMGSMSILSQFLVQRSYQLQSLQRKEKRELYVIHHEKNDREDTMQEKCQIFHSAIIEEKTMTMVHFSQIF